MTQPGPTARVLFPLEVDESGWPPVSAERLWAYELGNDLYRLDNVPWFVTNIACGDIVVATARSDDTHPTFVRRHRWGGHLTIRIIPFRRGPLQGDLGAVIDRFTPLGVWAEGDQGHGMVALDIPPDAALPPVRSVLLAGKQDGSWEWDEGCVSDAWLRLAEAPADPPRRQRFSVRKRP